MDTNLVKWTHYCEIAPGCAIHCIIIGRVGWLLPNMVKIFDDSGHIHWVRKSQLISKCE